MFEAETTTDCLLGPSSGANLVRCISTASPVPTTAPPRWSATHVLRAGSSLCAVKRDVHRSLECFLQAPPATQALYSPLVHPQHLRDCWHSPKLSRAAVPEVPASPGHGSSRRGPAERPGRHRPCPGQHVRGRAGHAEALPATAPPGDPRRAARPGRTAQPAPGCGRCCEGAGAGSRHWAPPQRRLPPRRPGQNATGHVLGAQSPVPRRGWRGRRYPHPASISAEPRRGRCPAPAAPLGSGEAQPGSGTRVSPGTRSARSRCQCPS